MTFLHIHTLGKLSSTLLHFIRFQVHDVIIFTTIKSHTTSTTSNHTQPTIHREIVTGACKRGNNPSFLITNTNLKESLGKAVKREENSYFFDVQTFNLPPKNINQVHVLASSISTPLEFQPPLSLCAINVCFLVISCELFNGEEHGLFLFFFVSSFG